MLKINSENSEKQIKRVKRRVYFGFVIIIAVMAASVAAGITALRVLNNAVEDLRFEYMDGAELNGFMTEETEGAAIQEVSEISADHCKESLTAELRLGELSRLLLSVLLADEEGEAADLSGTESIKASFSVNNRGGRASTAAILHANGTQLLTLNGIMDEKENKQYILIPELSSAYVETDALHTKRISELTGNTVGLLLNAGNLENSVKTGVIKLLYSSTYTSREENTIEAAGVKDECSVITFGIDSQKSGELIQKLSDSLNASGIDGSAVTELLAPWQEDITFKVIMNSEGKVSGYSFVNKDGSASFCVVLLKNSDIFGLEAELVTSAGSYRLYGSGKWGETCTADLVLEGANKLADVELNSFKKTENSFYLDVEVRPAEHLAAILAQRLDITQFKALIAGYTLRAVAKGNGEELTCEISAQNGESVFAELSVFANRTESEEIGLPEDPISTSVTTPGEMWAAEVKREELAENFFKCGIPKTVTYGLLDGLLK